MKRKFTDISSDTLEITTTSNFKYIIDTSSKIEFSSDNDVTRILFIKNDDLIVIYKDLIKLLINNVCYYIDLKYRDDLLNFISMK
jgi:hypothetical protein